MMRVVERSSAAASSTPRVRDARPPRAPIGIRTVREVARRLVVLALTIGLILMSPGGVGFVLAQAQPDPLALAIDRLDRYLAHVSELRDLIDRTLFDLDALSFELVFEEPETIVAWVREEISYEPYAGLLRGARGTLMSRAGNALDQAVLLATLLENAGYDARIAEGTLDAAGVDALLAEVAVPDPDPVWADPARVEATLARMAALVPPNVETFDRALREVTGPSEDQESEPAEADFGTAEFLEELELVQGVLSDADFAFSVGAAADAMREEVASYYWVEYQDAGDTSWQAAHPSFSEDPAPTTLRPTGEVFESEIPERLQHRLRFQVFVEQKLGLELVVNPVTGPWERPSANLHGTVQSFGNAPMSLTGLDDLASWPAMLDEAQIMAPTFGGAVAEGGQFFDLNGNVVPPDAAAAPAAGVIGEVGGAFGEAAGALDGRGDPESFVTLSAQWIEYTLIEPGGAERTVRRAVLDRVGAENRAAGVTDLSASMEHRDVVAALTTAHAFMVNVGSVPGGYVLDRILDAVERARPALMAVLERSAAPAEFSGPFPADVEIAESDLQLLRLYTTFDAPTYREQVRSYRSAASLVVIEQGAAPTADGVIVRVGVDIVSNEKRHLHVDPEALPALDPEVAVAAGVWETHVERMLYQADRPDLVEMRHLRETFVAAREHGAGFRLVRPGDADAVEGLELSTEARGNLERDLAAGYAVVVPTAPQEELGSMAWWRVHTATGETLGMTGDGRGGVLTEYLKTWATGFVVGFAACAIANVAITIVVRAAQGEVWHEGAPITPQELVQCVVTGLATGALAGAVLVPNVTLFSAGGKIATGGVPFNIIVAGSYTMVQFKTAVSALNIGFGFVLVQLNQYLVPSDWGSGEDP